MGAREKEIGRDLFFRINQAEPEMEICRNNKFINGLFFLPGKKSPFCVIEYPHWPTVSSKLDSYLPMNFDRKLSGIIFLNKNTASVLNYLQLFPQLFS